MITKVQKWGNSLAVRIPREMAQRFALKEGSDIGLQPDNGAIILRPEMPRHRTVRKNDWKRYFIPAKRKKQNVSGRVDQILYGASR